MFFFNVYCGYNVLKTDIFPHSLSKHMMVYKHNIRVVSHTVFLITFWCDVDTLLRVQVNNRVMIQLGFQKKKIFLTKFFLGTINCDKAPVIMLQITLIKPFRGPRDLPVLTLLCNVIQRPIQSDMNQWRPFPL